MASLCVMTACKKDQDGVTKDGAIDSKFSVSESRQVRFAKGNLQYQATTGTWRFAENQYDRIGYDNENISKTYSGWIDLFGWGTSGWDCGNTYYMPYDWEFVDDTDLGEGYGPLPANSFDLVGTYANCDWGVYNAISNGGNKAGCWRTLSVDEWEYLATKRPNAAAKYGVASIEGTNGMVLLPDEWTLPEGITFSPGVGAEDGKEFFEKKNSYTKEQWAQLEANGAVFLPAAGGRNEYKEITYVGEVGRYWSVSRCSTVPYFDTWCSFTFYFQSDDMLPRELNNPRNRGRSVRLVQDVN